MTSEELASAVSRSEVEVKETVGECQRCGSEEEPLKVVAVQDSPGGMLYRAVGEDCFDELTEWWDDGWN